MGIQLCLDLPADMLADRVAVGPHDSGLTFAVLQSRARAGADLLAGGNNVAYIGVNGPAFHVAVFAAAYAGKALCPLNYRLTDAELNALVDRLDKPVVLVDEAMRGRVAGSQALITTEELMSRTSAAPPGEPTYADDVDPAVILFTSGTTSAPKAVLLRHENLVSYILQTVELAAADESDCALVSVPPYHVAGVATVLSNAYAGRRVVHLSQFDAAGWLDVVEREGVSSAMLVPTMLARVVEELERSPRQLPQLRALAYGGARVSAGVLSRALAALPHTGFTNAYGLTETSSTITVLGPEEHRAALTDTALAHRLQSAGRPVDGVELQVRDEDGNVLGPGQSGLLFVRGSQVSGEYAELGSVLDADGWFPTKDRAHVDADGYLFLEGRDDDVIIRGGENVAPEEIEDVLLRHPLVADAAVVGIPDEEWGQRIGAVVVLRADGEVVPPDGIDAFAEQLRGWSREQLRSAKTPDAIVVVDELPYSPTGKLLRRTLTGRFTN